MKNILKQIEEGRLVVSVKPAPGYVEVQCLETQLKSRENWKNALMTLARRGAETLWIDIKDELPKDGEVVDIYIKSTHPYRIGEAIFNDKTEFTDPYFQADASPMYYLDEVSHWMRPPAAPNTDP